MSGIFSSSWGSACEPKAILCALFLATIETALLPAVAGAQQTESLHIDIPAGTLPDALASLARQTGVSVGMRGRLPGVATPAVQGEMDAEAALQRLLAGTGLTAVRIGPAAFRLQAAARPAQAVPPATAPPLHPPQPALEEIVITGFKRTQTLSTLPQAVSVVVLDGARPLPPQPSTADISSHSTGLTLTHLGPGRNRLFIRGIADTPFNGPSQSTVSMHLDNVRITYDAPDPDLRLVDVKRVEILKGPQGPLYGTGALGGIYHVVTRQPELSTVSGSLGAHISAVHSGGRGAGGEAIFNLPLARGRAGLRAVGYVDREPGWIDNADGRANANESHVRGGRLALRWLPSEDWTLDLGAALQLTDVEDSQYVLQSSHSLSRAGILPEPHDNDLHAFHGTITGPLAGLTLLAATSWVDHEVDSTLDAGASAADFGLPLPLRFFQRRRYRLFNQELRLSNDPSAAISWIGGLSLLDASRQGGDSLKTGSEAPLTLQSLHLDTREVAAFGELSLPLTGTAGATLGARLFHSQTEDERSEAGRTQSLKTGNTALTPSLSFSWQPSSEHYYYLRYAGALRPGGISPSAGEAGGRFKGDSLANLEAGTRLGFPGFRLHLDGSAYLSRWQHIQSDYLLDNGLVATRNAGDGRIYGVEGTLRWDVSPRWSLTAGATLQHARLVRSETGIELGEDTRLPVVPDVSANLVVGREIAAGQWSGNVEANLNYVGPSRLSFDPELDRSMGDYAVASVDAELSREHWQVGINIDNLFDRRADSFAFGNPFSIRAAPQYTPIRPRTVTMSVSRSW